VNSSLADLFGLDGTVALVTGGTSGLGAASARALAGAGAAVVVSGRHEGRGGELVEELVGAGSDAAFIAADVTRVADVERLTDAVLERFGRIDTLVHAAGAFRRRAALDLKAVELDWIVESNATATMLTCQAAGRHMLKRGEGSIITFGSTDAFIGIPEWDAYCMAKGAVVSLTRALAAEWSSQGVRVNCIAPSDFETPMLSRSASDPAYAEWIDAKIPIGRLGRPEEIAGAVLLLASSAGAMLTGQTLLVDGGRIAI